MKYLKLYESFIQKPPTLLIIEKGTELFHGTSVNFDKENIRGGGYDGVFWTTDTSSIAQTYISLPSRIYPSSSSIANPSEEYLIQKLQKDFGINYDYNDVIFKDSKPYSHTQADIFKNYYDGYYKSREEAYKLGQEIEKLKIEKEIDREKHYNLINKIYELELKKDAKWKEVFNGDAEKRKNQYVNIKLREMGYESVDRTDYDNSWELKFNNGKIQPENYKTPGKLLIIKPKRDLKIYDATLGGTIEADLTDEDYHKIHWFREAEERGYDGIKIADHCQSVDSGNFGHNSIGLFKNTLKDLEIDEIPAVHHELEPHYRRRDWESPEYKKYKNT